MPFRSALATEPRAALSKLRNDMIDPTPGLAPGLVTSLARARAQENAAIARFCAALDAPPPSAMAAPR
jgi:hypothetical protein